MTNIEREQDWKAIVELQQELNKKRAKFFSEYESMTTGSYGDTRRYQVHPNWVEYASAHQDSTGIDIDTDDVPDWAIIEC